MTPARAAVDAVQAATRALIDAAVTGDAEAIDAATQARAAAVEELVRRLGAAVDPATRRAVLAATALSASEAEGALRGLVESTRRSLETQQSGGRALRGYGAFPESSALDRSG
jgi:hypothetical protein